MIDENRAIDAYKFLSMNRFLIYMRGPFKKAKPVKIANIVNVNMRTNLSGDRTIIVSIIKLRNPKKTATTKEMIA